jgi:hypothetical protein
LTHAKLTRFVIGGNSCDGGNWLGLVLDGNAEPPVWGILGLRDAQWAKNAEVSRLRQLEHIGEEQDMEIQRGVLSVKFPKASNLPSLLFVARKLGYRQFTETDPAKDTILGSAWSNEVFLNADTLRQLGIGSAELYDKPRLSFLGSPQCPPPPP